MTVIGEILAAIAALPKIIEAIGNVIRWARRTFGPDWVGELTKLGTCYQKLGEAKTDVEKDEALKNLSRLWNH